MAKYGATIMHGNRDAQRTIEFDGPDDLIEHSPMTVMRAFMDYVEAHAHIGHIDYEANAAMKNAKADVVTVLGELKFASGDHQPFMCMISAV
ncbi:MAG: hypothetical protein CML68_01225 [Rhodobacteraceae bacterium]|nr:hypothetical protein [Paracoccaceae bacterium]